jgi:hypothetical protein
LLIHTTNIAGEPLHGAVQKRLSEGQIATIRQTVSTIHVMERIFARAG